MVQDCEVYVCVCVCVSGGGGGWCNRWNTQVLAVVLP